MHASKRTGNHDDSSLKETYSSCVSADPAAVVTNILLPANIFAARVTSFVLVGPMIADALLSTVNKCFSHLVPTFWCLRVRVLFGVCCAVIPELMWVCHIIADAVLSTSERIISRAFTM